MNEVRTKQIASILAEAIYEALEPLRECIEQTKAKLSVIESGIKTAAASQEARSCRIAELKRSAGIPVSADGNDAPIIRWH
jgi:hypothetical protein